MNVLQKIPRNTHGFCIRIILFVIIYSINIWGYMVMNNALHNMDIESNASYLIFFLYPCLGLFILTRWNTIKEMAGYRNKKWETFILLVMTIGMYMTPATLLYFRDITDSWLISVLTPFFLSHALLFLAIFNIHFVKQFLKDLIVCALAIGTMLFATYFLELHWSIFSKIIMQALEYILPLIDKTVIIYPRSYIVGMNNFRVSIGASCSGIYSLAAFTLLFMTTLYLASMHHGIRKFRALMAWLCGMVIVFTLNIIRIIAIILVGAYYSPEIAIKLFHEYLGAIFLLILFFVYLKYILPKITTPKLNIVKIAAIAVTFPASKKR